jgi:RimJ/RimL family protein N-acetyltransferase
MLVKSTPAELFPPEGLLGGRAIRLRRFVAADITHCYLGWLNDTELLRFSNQRFNRHDAASARAYLDSFFGTPNLFIAICERASGELVGTMTAYVSMHHSTCDVGILVGDRAHLGQGLGREAWCLLVDWLLTAGGIRKLTAGCAAGNYPMLRIMDTAKMEYEGTRRDQEIIDGAPHDLVYYSRFGRS